MASDDDFNLNVSDIRWRLEPFTAMDADELLAIDPAALADVDDPLAPIVVTLLKDRVCLSNRICTAAFMLQTVLTNNYQLQVENKRLEERIRALLKERGKP